MASRSLSLLLVASALGATLLSACGTVPNAAATGTPAMLAAMSAQSKKTASKSDAPTPPDVTADAKSGSTSAGDTLLGGTYKPPYGPGPNNPSGPGNQNSQIENICTNALYRYVDERRQWMGAYDLNEKDRIAQEMVNTLTDALDQVAQQDGYSQLGSTARNDLQQIRYLQRQWDNTYDDNAKRSLVNQMLEQATSDVKNLQTMAAE
ncbi:MAG TPA: hypothetical protein V6D47_05775 [Oscillatoriaceae cyanobacterium]